MNCVAVTLGGLDARLGEHEAVYRSVARWLARGFTKADVAGIVGGNFVRFWRRAAG